MIKDNTVIFKGRKDGIMILLDSGVDFPVIKSVLKDKILESRKFFGETKTPISFSGRDLTEDEKKELILIIEKNSDIQFVDRVLDENSVTKTDSMTPKEEPDPIQKEITKLIGDQYKAHSTVFHKGNLRGGASIRHAGSVVLLGDLNPGAEIIAEGNIVILGAAKGLVHAGCNGDNSCYVAALKLEPTQLRISDVITYIPPEKKKRKVKDINPVYAYIENSQIFISPMYN